MPGIQSTLLLFKNKKTHLSGLLRAEILLSGVERLVFLALTSEPPRADPSPKAKQVVKI
jgi:hypothetical protein